MTHTKQNRSTRTTISLGAAAGLALIAGIAPRVDDQPPAQHANVAVESYSVAAWAQSESLSGLSPASLRDVRSSDPETLNRLERAAIGDWARNQGLSGLSPASLAPVR